MNLILQFACLVGIVPLVLLDRHALAVPPERDELGTNFAIAAVLVLSDALVLTALFGLYSAVQPHVALIHPPVPLQVVLALILGDFLSYWHHRALHGARWLWASHIVHHQSCSLDLSSGLRNHPLGTVSQGLFWSPLLLLGITPGVMLLAAASIGSWVVFIHSRKARRLGWREGKAGLVLNLPTHHLMHHRAAPSGANCNFGLLLSIWDRLFRTFCAPAASGPLGIADAPSLGPLRRLLWDEWRRRFGREPGAQSSPPITREQGLAAYVLAVIVLGAATGWRAS